MKQRLKYIFLSALVILPSLISCLSSQTAYAATGGGLNGFETGYCSKQASESVCEKGFSQGLKDQGNGTDDPDSFCATYVSDPGATRFGPAPSSGDETSCESGYSEAQTKADGILYCTGAYVAGAFADCMGAYYAGYGASTDTSASYCKNPPSGLSTSSCEDMFKAGFNKNPTNAPTTPAPLTGVGSASVTCSTEGGDFAVISWIICPIITGIADASNGIYKSFVQPLLHTDPVNLSSDKSNNIYAVWSNFRIYGDIFLIIVLLIVVFGESIGGGMVDAYTAKKILPRLLAAAIFINLSIYMVAFMIDVTNIIGIGIQSLIQAPFQTATSNFQLSLNPATSSTLGIAGVLGVSGTIWAAIALSSSAIITAVMSLALIVVLPIVLTVLAIMVTLVVRQGLILFLLFVSPVAFALYCLPNTEKYFRKWWDLLFRCLLIYPIVGVAFAMGNVMSSLTSTLFTGLAGYLASFVSVIILFIPLVSIPYAFRIAGGVIGNFHSAVTGVRDRAHAMTENRRQVARSKLDRVTATARSDGYTRFNNTKLGEGLQRVPLAGGVITKRGARAEQHVSRLGAQIAKDEKLAPVANDALALKAGMAQSAGQAVKNLMDQKETKQNAEAAVERWKATGLGFSESAGQAAFQAAVADGTVFKDGPQQANAIVGIAGKNKALRDRIYGSAYAGNKQAGRFDLSPSYGTGQDLVERVANGEAVSDAEWDAAAVEGFRNTSNTQLSQSKGPGISNGGAAMARHVARQRQVIDLDTPRTTDMTLTQTQRDEATTRVDNARTQMTETMVKLDNMRDSSMYFPEAAIANLSKQITQREDPITSSAVQNEHKRSIVNEHLDSSGNVEYRKDAAGNNLLDARNNPIPVIDVTKNPDFDSNVETTQRQRPRGDPRDPGQPLDPSNH
jgi:hypothetical protein